MSYKIAIMKGDGIGPEISQVAESVINTIAKKNNIEINIQNVQGGDSSLSKNGIALPEETIALIKESDACLKGPVGESAMDVIVKLRQMFDLYVNLRPIVNLPNIKSIETGIDLMIVRENTEDLYAGMEFKINEGAIALKKTTKKNCERIIDYAFKVAMNRNKKLVAVHKSNVLRLTDGLFSEIAKEYSVKYPEVEFSEMYVDACAMNLIRNPKDFDVIVTTNLYGDILSDEAAQIIGGLGISPSANIGNSFAIFEPVHGAAPDISGKGIANPFSIILSVKMMLTWLGEKNKDEKLKNAANSIDKSIINTLEKKIMTPDLGGSNTTKEVGKELIDNIINQYE
tara:strand:+ start:565 stop:1590 length:1026 start_codon:yes stop_codon:yes gene_type:complete